MSTVEPNHTALLQNNVKYVFNLFNIPRPYSTSNINNINVVTNQQSPTPSVLSENSVECILSGHNMVSDAASSCSEESEELTNLTWLTELRNELLTWPDSVQQIVDENCSHRKCANGKNASNNKSTEENTTPSQQKRPTAAERYNIFLDKIKKDIIEYDLAADVYQKDVEEKPPFNYSHIIGMAMVENGRMTLQQICSWIESKFAFFRVRKRWNNSIRHNLSLHHCFKKIDRSKYEKGKGGYWELGIDPKKCDRKRIRNRKSSNRNRNRLSVGGDGGEGQKQTNYETMSTTTKPDMRVVENGNVEEFDLDELDVQQNVVIKKDTSMNTEFLTSIMSSSGQTTTTTLDDSSRMCPYDISHSIKLQDVFIANAGNENDNNNYSKLSNSQNLSGDAEYELGTIIVNSSADLGGVPSMNISDIEQQINVFVEDEIPEPCENVVISSHLTNGTIGNQSQPNVIVEQMEPYCTVSTSSECSFRPYIDGIDEAFQYLRSMDTRCDDLFDNLLDISATIYCLIFILSFEVDGTTTSNGNPTHLKPLITNNIYSISSVANSNNSHQSDTTAQESIKIENRQLYDTVKHASGYDSDNNNSSNNSNNSYFASLKEIDEVSINNSSSSTTSTRVRIHPRKSAVIQAIPRKVRGPGGNTQSTTISGVSFVKPTSSLQQNVKDYGAGEPTTTIVYATSIPSSMPSRTFVNIRPVPLLSNQKYRSTFGVENERVNHHHQDVENTKQVVENHQQYPDNEREQNLHEESNNEENHQEHKLLVSKKTTLRDDPIYMQSTTPRTQDAILPYQTDYQKRNPFKSILYSRIRTNNEEITDELSSKNRNTFYPNHKWTGEDYIQRGSQILPPPLPPASTHFVYENPDPRRDFYHPAMSPHTHPPAHAPAQHQSQTQNFFRPRYIATDSYQEEKFNPAFDPVTQQQIMHGLLAQHQQQRQQQQQQYQPLTIRDFDLLLQLLVLREQRLNAGHQNPFLSSALSDFNCRNNQQENNYYYASPKALASSVHEYPNNFKNRELLRSQQQQELSTTKLLPSKVREELLFRMLLLALHLQPQTQSQPQLKPVSGIPTMSPEHHHHPNMYIVSRSSSPPEPSIPYLEFRHSHRSASVKNPVRSVQVLGEID